MNTFAFAPLFPERAQQFRDRSDTHERRRVEMSSRGEMRASKALARFVLTGGALTCTITGMTYLLELCLLLLALWLASEIVARDLSAPAPKDPYRLDRWRKGEGDPDQ